LSQSPTIPRTARGGLSFSAAGGKIQGHGSALNGVGVTGCKVPPGRDLKTPNQLGDQDVLRNDYEVISDFSDRMTDSVRNWGSVLTWLPQVPQLAGLLNGFANPEKPNRKDRKSRQFA